MKIYSIQNVAVPIGLSESSLNAFDTAVALTKKHKANIYILQLRKQCRQWPIATSLFLRVLMFCKRWQALMVADCGLH